MWYDFFKLFQYALGTEDPITRKSNRDFVGAGVSGPEAMPDIRAMSDGSAAGGRGSVRLRDTNDFVDLSTVTNRMHRYKEYDRLRGMAEIEMALTVFADEACLSGDTLVATPAYGDGFKSLKWLAENVKEERFLVYCYDFQKMDYTLGWAFDPRLVKQEETIKVYLEDGNSFVCTRDHRILMKDGSWKPAGELKEDDLLMPFLHYTTCESLNKCKTNQFPRIWTHNKGWIHERQFVDEWRTGKEDPKMQIVNKFCNMFADGLSYRQIMRKTKKDIKELNVMLTKHGWSSGELAWLGRREKHRKVLNVCPHKKMDVYDLSVQKHENFCTNWGVVHNCQRDENGRVFEIICENEDIREELEFLCFNRKMLGFDQKKLWKIAKDLFCNGDDFWELIINTENPKDGIVGFQRLPADTMYRIETTKARVVEFQQSKEGPDYQSLARVDVLQASDAELSQATAIRFAPDQIIHLRIGDDRKTFYPYGVSLIEAARGPAHQLRLLEDAMIVYRLSRAPERRIFYIDVQQLPPFKAEALVERMKDQFKKKKVPRPGEGASGVDEKWHAPAADEDYWIPTRPNSNTRVETLPGASNLGEIDDTVYFRNKTFIALNFPKNYFNNEDAQVSRVSLSSVDVKFARMIERLQSHIEDGIWELCDRHLRLRGVPEEMYDDLQIKMTPPSDHREITRTEVISGRIQNAGSIKGSQIMSDFDILTKYMKFSEEETKVMLARLKIQKLEDLKLQIVAQNPQLLGVGLPSDDEESVSTSPSDQNPMLGGSPTEENPESGENQASTEEPTANQKSISQKSSPLPKPSEDDLKKYNLDIKDYASDAEEEEWSDE